MERNNIMKLVILILILIFFGVTTWKIKNWDKEPVIDDTSFIHKGEIFDGTIVSLPKDVRGGEFFHADSYTYIDTVSGILLNFVDGKVEIRVKK